MVPPTDFPDRSAKATVRERQTLLGRTVSPNGDKENSYALSRGHATRTGIQCSL